MHKDTHDLKELTPTGTSVVVEGTITATPEGVKQLVELRCSKVVFVGPCDAKKYPIAKKVR